MRVKMYKDESLAIEFCDMAGNPIRGMGMTITNMEGERPEFTGPWNENRETFVVSNEGIVLKWKKK